MKKLLLDTHAALWWQSEDRRLRPPARRAIAAADVVWVSAATGWEAAIKVSQGRLRLREPFSVTLIADDFTELPVTLQHAQEFARLPRHHGDPFDRLVIAQARVEGATIVTHDRAFEPYGVPVIWT
ncbi:MAG TPA: type II toxin-antitoxin system VapC family toxin [Vicinamibacterales bacterium]